MENQENIINLIDENLCDYLGKSGWKSLTPIQLESFKPVFQGNQDVFITAPTSGGKTESFFLPALTKIKDNNGVGILYISPLKALINDQAKRIENLGKPLNIKVTPWHGDIAEKTKNDFINKSSGVLLTNPESLEAILINKKANFHKQFASLKYIVIDEFHYFINTERGAQLMSLLFRLETLTGIKIPRVALSATVETGSISSLQNSLRPEDPDFKFQLVSIDSDKSKLSINFHIEEQSLDIYKLKQLILENSIEKFISSHHDFALFYNSYKEELDFLFENKKSSLFNEKIYQDSYKLLSGFNNVILTKNIINLTKDKNHLIFANSRSSVEELGYDLKRICKFYNIQNHYLLHHGMLSNQLRS
ncbi:MAG: DEAD/DEAH box helicase, partial [Psittacicella sp.]